MEIEAVSEFIRNLLTGDVDELPTETLVHHFWTFVKEHKQVIGYLNCLKSHQLTQVECYRHSAVYCGSRFGEKPPERLELCRQLLSNEINATTAGVDAHIFNNRISCFQWYRRRVDRTCTHELRKAIVGRRLRATKVVRATMESMEPLLKALPALRIIHLVRDPRAVGLSRIKFGASGCGWYTQRLSESSGSRIVAEASLYCHHVTADIRSRLALEREFPGRIKSVRYEDVVANPEQSFRDIYTFLDEPAPFATLREMQRMATKGRTMNLSTKWQQNMSYMEAIAIARRCNEFFHLMNISAIDI